MYESMWCTRQLAPGEVEWDNVLTSFPLFLAGLMLFVKKQDVVLSLAVMSIGFGSIAFHAFPIQLTRIMDEGAIVIYLLRYLATVICLPNPLYHSIAIVTCITLLFVPSGNAFILLTVAIIAYLHLPKGLHIDPLTRYLFLLAISTWILDFLDCRHGQWYSWHACWHILISLAAYRATCCFSKMIP